MKKKRIVALALAAASAFALTACNGGGGNADDTIRIGGLAPLTGENAIYGIACTNGANLAFDEINAKGGVLGKKIVYECLDEKGDMTEATNAYRKLSSKGIVALLGDVTSKPSAAVAELAVQDEIPMVSATATAPDVTKDKANVFRVCFLDPFQGQTMAVFAAEKLNAKTAAIVYNTSNDYSVGVAEKFKSVAESKGIQIVSYEGYGNDDKDFRAQLTNIATKNPDVLFVPDYYQKDSMIASQAREVGLKATFLGVDGWDGVIDVATNKETIEGAYFCNHYSTEDPDETVQQFIKNYTDKYNETPVSFAALGYDTAMIIADAIERAGSTDKEAIVKALNETDFTGVTGHITFDGNGDPIKNVSIIKIVDGKYTLDSKITPQ